VAVTATQLRAAQDTFESSRLDIEAARIKRNRLVLRASEEGMSDAAIAKAARLGPHRVRQIIVNETMPLDWIPDRRQLALFDLDRPSPCRSGRLAA
jgi:hypothetical protein